LAALGQFLSAAQQQEIGSPAELISETQRLAAQQLTGIEQLGALTGEMHLALSHDANDPDFAPRPLLPAQVATWQATIRDESDTILGELGQRVGDLPAAEQAAIAALLDSRPRIAQRIAQLEALGNAGMVVTRFHGDYHLGQVLVSGQGWLILDFEGEPLRTLAERRAHSSPLKDVAGMLRSFGYAAYSAVLAAEQQILAANPAETAGSIRAQLLPWAAAWEQCARAAFSNGYIQATQQAPFVPQEPALRDAAIAVFELEKGLYELNYELNNRPDWLPIPLQGIQRVI
jgi:maltose alpha-D-glucosyltransferase/alpha-amylase